MDTTAILELTQSINENTESLHMLQGSLWVFFGLAYTLAVGFTIMKYTFNK